MWSPAGYEGLNALLSVRKSRGSDLLVHLLDSGRPPSVFVGAGEERGFFSLPLFASPNRVSRSSCFCLCCRCCAERVVDDLSADVALWYSV